MKKGPLILVSDNIDGSFGNGDTSAHGLEPRRDYLEIAQQLSGELSGYKSFDGAWYRWIYQFERFLKLDLVEALSAAKNNDHYNIILSASEKIAIPLAAALYLKKQDVSHIMIGHKLSSVVKRNLFNLWPVHQTFAHVICLCRSQLDYAVNRLGIPESRVSFVYDKVDHNFFSPLNLDSDGYILAVGQEQRDYQALLKAVAGTNLKVIIVASSPWSTHQQPELQQAPQVTWLQNISYQALRDLYAKARLVIVPLNDVDYAAGVNALLEAMAMGKPVVVTRTQGITDYVKDDETGRYVTPGSVEELKDAIFFLLNNPAVSKRLGANARQAVEETMNLDIYVKKIAQIVRKFEAITA